MDPWFYGRTIVVDTIHSLSNKFFGGVKIKATGELKLNDSLVVCFKSYPLACMGNSILVVCDCWCRHLLFQRNKYSEIASLLPVFGKPLHHRHIKVCCKVEQDAMGYLDKVINFQLSIDIYLHWSVIQNRFYQ